MTRILKFMFLTLVVILALLLGISCTPQRKPLDPNRGAPVDPDRRGQNIGNGLERDTRRIEPQLNTKRNANEIARQAAGTQGVEKAYVVVTGKTAIIGLDLKSNITGENTKNIKNQVANKAKGTKGITNAEVTSNPDLVARIKDIAGGISNGRPLSEFNDQLKEILNRVKAES